MPFSLRKLSRLHLIALLVVAMIGMATFGFGFRDWFSRKASVTAMPQQIRPEAAAVTAPDGVTQLLLRPEGFDSTEFTLPKGRYLLILQNRTGLDNLALQVSRLVGNGEKPKDVAFDSKKKYRIESLIDLTPGDYAVTVQGYPDWTCRLTVTSK